jgi:hypothetical protein
MRRTSPARSGRRPRPAATWAVTWAATLVAALVLAGCGGGDASDDAGAAGGLPSSTTTGAPTTTSSPTPSASATVHPNELAAAGALTQVQIMYAQYNLMITTGSSERYRETFTPACVLCRSDAIFVEVTAAKDRQVRGGICTVSHLKVMAVRKDTVVIEGLLSETPAKVLDGKVLVKRLPGQADTKMTWIASNASGAWLITKAQAARAK